MIDAARTEEAAAKRLTKRLKAEVDETLSCEFIGPRAAGAIGTALGDLVPGRWHIVRRPVAGSRTPGAASEGLDSYWPVMGDEGEYVDPTDFTDSLIAEMKEKNLWRKGALQELLDRRRKEVEAQEKAEALATEQRRDEMAEDHRAMMRIPGSGGLRRRMAGKK